MSEPRKDGHDGDCTIYATLSHSVERTSRQVIERKLLTALDDKTKVAILASKQDLEDLIEAFDSYLSFAQSKDRFNRCMNFKQGLSQLLAEAFPSK